MNHDRPAGPYFSYFSWRHLRVERSSCWGLKTHHKQEAVRFVWNNGGEHPFFPFSRTLHCSIDNFNVNTCSHLILHLHGLTAELLGRSFASRFCGNTRGRKTGATFWAAQRTQCVSRHQPVIADAVSVCLFHRWHFTRLSVLRHTQRGQNAGMRPCWLLRAAPSPLQIFLRL